MKNFGIFEISLENLFTVKCNYLKMMAVGSVLFYIHSTKAHSNIGMYQNVIWVTKYFDAYMTSIDATFEIELRQIIKPKLFSYH